MRDSSSPRIFDSADTPGKYRSSKRGIATLFVDPEQADIIESVIYKYTVVTTRCLQNIRNTYATEERKYLSNFAHQNRVYKDHDYHNYLDITRGDFFCGVMCGLLEANNSTEATILYNPTLCPSAELITPYRFVCPWVNESDLEAIIAYHYIVCIDQRWGGTDYEKQIEEEATILYANYRDFRRPFLIEQHKERLKGIGP